MHVVDRPLPPPLPATVEDFLAKRKTSIHQNLNDAVEAVHLALYTDDEYQKLLYAVYDEQAVEGSIAADNIMAARMLREKADEMQAAILRGEKLATIAKALGVVLRRYHESRKERRNTVAGTIVPDENGD